MNKFKRKVLIVTLFIILLFIVTTPFILVHGIFVTLLSLTTTLIIGYLVVLITGLLGNEKYWYNPFKW